MGFSFVLEFLTMRKRKHLLRRKQKQFKQRFKKLSLLEGTKTQVQTIGVISYVLSHTQCHHSTSQ
jgi:hypothetical protein